MAINGAKSMFCGSFATITDKFLSQDKRCVKRHNLSVLINGLLRPKKPMAEFERAIKKYHIVKLKTQLSEEQIKSIAYHSYEMGKLYNSSLHSAYLTIIKALDINSPFDVTDIYHKVTNYLNQDAKYAGSF